MRILIIGAGAIGCFLAQRLSASGQEITLAVRAGAMATMQTQRLRVVEVDGSVNEADVTMSPGITPAITSGAPYDLAIVAVKAYDTDSVAAELGEHAMVASPILTVQNGVGNEEIFAEALPSTQILSGALTTPVEVIERFHVQVARSSFTMGVAPGPGNGDVGSLTALFTAAGFSSQIFADYHSLKWTKLLMNILANAQAAILRYTPGEVFANSELGNLEVRAWRETLAVMGAQDISLVSLAGYPLPQVRPLIERMPFGLVRRVLGRFIRGGHGQKMPSLYYDLYPEVRSRSEISWLNGAVVTAAHKHNLSAPVNETFSSIITEIVSGRDAPEHWAGQPQRLLQSVTSRDR